MERIDVAKLLKECPSGMKLDSTMYENVVFDKIIEDDKIFPIRVIRSEDGCRMSLTKYGQYSDIGSAKCIIFPEGKTTWKEFHRPFKDGDIIRVRDEYSDASFIYVAILKQIEKGGKIYSHCFYNYEDDEFSTHDFLYDGYNIRFATEEEKEKLFKVIKDNGYRWNPESKTLEKLIQPKFKVGDIVRSKNCIDAGNFIIVGVEENSYSINIKNYCIEFKDQDNYELVPNNLDKLVGLKFKVGDRIRHKCPEFRGERIVNICCNTGYFTTINDWIDIAHQDDWELVSEKLVGPKFNVGDRIKQIKTGNIYEIIKIIPNYYITRHLGSDIMISFNRQDEYELAPVEPKFKVDDKIKLKGGDEFGIITQVADCFYTIKCKNNTHCWPIKRQDDWELINKPKFKVGDRITLKNRNDGKHIYKITKVKNDCYETDQGELPFYYEDTWKLVPDKFDINTLRAFDKVLMRSSNAREWVATFYSHYSNNKFYGCGMCCDQCIPYEGNEHLLGKTDDCDEYFKNLIS